jgi:hypothetical protein
MSRLEVENISPEELCSLAGRDARQHSLKVENAGQVADASIFQPEPEKHRYAGHWLASLTPPSWRCPYKDYKEQRRGETRRCSLMGRGRAWGNLSWPIKPYSKFQRRKIAIPLTSLTAIRTPEPVVRIRLPSAEVMQTIGTAAVVRYGVYDEPRPCQLKQPQREIRPAFCIRHTDPGVCDHY